MFAAAFAFNSPIATVPSAATARRNPASASLLRPLPSQNLSLRRVPLPHRIRRRRVTIAAAFQPSWIRAVQTTWRIGRDGIEAGANFLPDNIPRPIARISVAVIAGVVMVFLLKSLLSTAFFVLGMVGLIYFLFIAFNADKASSGSGSSTLTEDDALEEARRIMEKYK